MSSVLAGVPTAGWPAAEAGRGRGSVVAPTEVGVQEERRRADDDD
jgi:hypothetical protein